MHGREQREKERERREMKLDAGERGTKRKGESDEGYFFSFSRKDEVQDVEEKEKGRCTQKLAEKTFTDHSTLSQSFFLSLSHPIPL